ncbi:MAG: MBL fold metallo-hydrolase [Bacteroidia bacterium]|nr:MBL fold metallo-hydrolase [Bacteroidia bacterium]
MYVEQLYTNCLAHAAYYIESNGEVAIIDPLRDFNDYISKANTRNAKIKYVFETHFHADFVSGHIDLAQKTGATIVFGPTANTGFQSYVAKDNEEFKLGNIVLKVLHTPGHTPESICILLINDQSKPLMVFTGDTLFVGEVGRPDLLEGVFTKEDLASNLFDSLHNKLLTLPDDVLVYPAHGAGSACGKNIGKELNSTIGEQRKFNYALQIKDKDNFIKTITDGIPSPPAYFFKDAKLNKQGYTDFDKIMEQANKPLSVNDFEMLVKQGATIIDTRIPDVFEIGFVPGAINFGLNGQYAIWAATVLDISTELVIVAEQGKEQESIERLTRVGFDNIKGFLQGSFEAWKDADKRYDMVISIDNEEFELDVKHSDSMVLDVRKPTEYNELHMDTASNFPLDTLNTNFETLDKEKPYLIHCAGGYRSMIAASLLKKKGFKNVKNVWGGFNKIKERNGLKFKSVLSTAN